MWEVLKAQTLGFHPALLAAAGPRSEGRGGGVGRRGSSGCGGQLCPSDGEGARAEDPLHAVGRQAESRL